MNLWANAIAYQLAWLAAIAGAGHGWWWPGVAAWAAFAIWQCACTAQPRADLLLMACAAVLGFVLDSALLRSGLLGYAAAFPAAGFAPAWIVALWMSFALTLNHSLAWLKSHLLAAAVLGAVGAPLAYWIAARTWHAVTVRGEPAVVFATLAAIWLLATPALCLLARALRDSHPHAPVMESAR